MTALAYHTFCSLLQVHRETQNGEYNYNNGITPGQNIPLPNSSGYISDKAQATVSSTDAPKLCVSTSRLTSNNMTSIYQPLNDAILLPSGAQFWDYNKTANGLPVSQPVDNPTHQLCVSAQTFFDDF